MLLLSMVHFLLKLFFSDLHDWNLPLKSVLRFFSFFSFLHPLVALLLCILLAGCTLSPLPGRGRLTVREAKEKVALGKFAYRQVIQKNGGLYQNDELATYVSRVGERLVSQGRRFKLKYRFAVINDSVPNAFALSGGYIALTRGLLVNLSNEAELAALLAHQIGHLAAGWQVPAETLRRFNDSVADDPLASSAAAVTAELISRRYSPEQELEADRFAIASLQKAGYDPSGALQVQELFHHMFEQDTDHRWREGLFRSHPFSAERLAENRRYIGGQSGKQSGEQSPPPGAEEQAALEFTQAFQSLRQTQQGYATFDQARLMEHEGQLAEAIALYHQALLESSEEPLIMSSLGLAYLRNEDLIPARRYLIKAVNRQGDYYQSRLALGYVYQQKEQYTDALQQLEAGFKLLPTPEGGYMLAEVREQRGDKEGARKLYAAVAEAEGAGKLGPEAAERLRMLE